MLIHIIPYFKNSKHKKGSQLSNLGIVDDIFGPATERYVSRTQMSALSSEIFSKLNIIEDYQISNSEFSQAFVQDFIAQTASQAFAKVNVNDSLSILSTYDLKGDLQPDLIKSELSKIFTINASKSIQHLILNQTYYDHLKDNNHFQADGMNLLFLKVYHHCFRFNKL